MFGASPVIFTVCAVLVALSAAERLRLTEFVPYETMPVDGILVFQAMVAVVAVFAVTE